MAPTIVVVHMVSGSSRDPRLGFDPAEIRIILGLNNTVTWKNDDSDWHTAHSNIPEFDSKMIPPAGSYTHTFLTVGIYPYHCDPHPWMTGKITVTTAGSSTVSALSSSGTLNTDLVQPECWVVESNDSSIPEPALCVA
jgi:plastocyanin